MHLVEEEMEQKGVTKLNKAFELMNPNAIKLYSRYTSSLTYKPSFLACRYILSTITSAHGLTHKRDRLVGLSK